MHSPEDLQRVKLGTKANISEKTSHLHEGVLVF
jgi:hypothetical protein